MLDLRGFRARACPKLFNFSGPSSVLKIWSMVVLPPEVEGTGDISESTSEHQLPPALVLSQLTGIPE